ncbi:MAG: FimV/HubP family polar landmark protein, partial [Aeromonas sp.]
SSVSVYQTMVAIYTKNPRSFADGNINHILVGSRIVLPTVAEASVITDAQARARFRSDNASWKGLSPKYLANKQTHSSKPVVAQQVAKPVAANAAVVNAAPGKVAVAPVPVVNTAPIPVASTAVQPVAEVTTAAKVNEPIPALPQPVVVPKAGVATAPSVAPPAPLPSDLDKPVGKPTTEMALALEDANAQLGQVSEMNHRLKLRLQSLTEEVETLKAQLQDQTALQKEIAELKAQPVAPAVAASEPKPHWLMDLLASPLNLAMIILLPVLLVLALVTLWLRARARRELEEQEKSLSESTAMMMDQEQSEFDNLLKVEVTDNEPVRPVVAVNPEAAEQVHPEVDLVFRDGRDVLPQERTSQPVAAQPVSADPDLVPDLDRWLDQPITLADQPDMDLAGEFNPKASKEIMSEEALQAALFAELDVDIEPELSPQAKDAVNRVVDVASFDLSDFESAFEQQMPAKAIDLSRPDSTDEMLAE